MVCSCAALELQLGSLSSSSCLRAYVHPATCPWNLTRLCMQAPVYPADDVPAAEEGVEGECSTPALPVSCCSYFNAAFQV
jgi:hypothetical protein